MLPRLARLCQAGPASGPQQTTPPRRPPPQARALPPADPPAHRPKTVSKQIYANELLQGPLHICSAEVPLQTSPASLPTLQPPTLGAGGGEKEPNSV